MRLVTLSGCALAIGGWPRFGYNARGGGGEATVCPRANGRLGLIFEAAGLRIPPLNSSTTRILGLPMPPPLTLRILAERLEGDLDPVSGAVRLWFEARFQFSVGRLYQAPDLRIATELSTGAANGSRHRATGRALLAGNPGQLVGVAAVAPCGEAWLDRMLGLPDEALAVLRCRFEAGPPAHGPAPAFS
ncbi:MAG: hypothetical protein VKM01_05390 [Cyanobacteriota bacterium]|nr:hypothetical protein [Cyanobacteriota bacterium]